MNTGQNLLKQQAGQYAAALVQSRQTVGLGSGTTSAEFVKALGNRWQRSEVVSLQCVATSKIIAELASYFQLPLLTLGEVTRVDMTVDGADEVSLRTRAMIKGGRGAAYSERRLAQKSERLVIIVDDQKVSEQLGQAWAVPIDIERRFINPDLFQTIPTLTRVLQQAGAIEVPVKARLTDSGEPYRTDDDRYVIDVNFGPIADPNQLALDLDDLVGQGLIASHGLFVDLATDLVIAYPDRTDHHTWTDDRWQLHKTSP